MASREAFSTDRSVSVGRIFSRAFSVMGAHPLTTFGTAFLFGALPQLLFNFGARPLTIQLAAAGPLTAILVSLISVAVALILSTLVQGALVRVTVAHAAGGTASFGESLAAGLSVALPLIGLAILSGIAILFAMILLIVPGIILYVMWCVCAPVLVEERTGIFAAFGRSRYLTKGARWQVFGTLLVLLILSWIVSGIIGYMTIASVGVVSSSSGFGDLPIGILILTAISGTLFTTLFSTVQTSIYVDLREWKEGPASEQLAEVFA